MRVKLSSGEAVPKKPHSGTTLGRIWDILDGKGDPPTEDEKDDVRYYLKISDELHANIW